MKAIKMIKLIMLGAMVFGIGSGIANAALITGGMGVTGSYTADSTTFTFGSASGTSGTDILGTTVGFGTAGTVVEANDTINYDTFSSLADILEIGGWQFDMSTLIVGSESTFDRLKFSGTGLVSGNGYDITDVTWDLSANATGSSYSMSITAAVVPVPAAVWLFGSGLLGLVGIARRKV